MSSSGSIGCFRDLHDHSRSQRIRQVVAHDNFHVRPDHSRLGSGFGNFLIGVGSFVQQHPGSRLQSRAEERENAGHFARTIRQLKAITTSTVL